MLATFRRGTAIVGALLVAGPALARAQSAGESVPSVDSLTRALEASDLGARSMAVAALSTYAPSNLPVVTRLKLVALLEEQAATPSAPRADAGEDGAEGLYVTALVRAVVLLDEPRALRGLALAGLAVTVDAQRFVASQGDAAIPFLTEAEADTTNRSAVAATRARMLADYSGALSARGRIRVHAALYGVAAADPLAFANAANVGRLIDAGPALETLASIETDPLARTLLGDAAAASNARRSQASVEELIASLTAELSAVCGREGEQPQRNCQSLNGAAQSALAQLRAGQPASARRFLQRMAAAADEAARRGDVTSLDAETISGMATYLATRI